MAIMMFRGNGKESTRSHHNINPSSQLYQKVLASFGEGEEVEFVDWAPSFRCGIQYNPEVWIG